MDYLSKIKRPNEGDMNNFVRLFDESLTYGEEAHASYVGVSFGTKLRHCF